MKRRRILCATLAVAAILTACAGPSWNVLPHQEVAYAVVSSVETETSMDSACSRASVRLVAADVSSRLGETGGREALVVARSSWDSLQCPEAAAPGLSFGAADAARMLRRQTAGARS
jgi:hypothetical protein